MHVADDRPGVARDPGHGIYAVCAARRQYVTLQMLKLTALWLLQKTIHQQVTSGRAAAGQPR